jgi:hypothetical protein
MNEVSLFRLYTLRLCYLILAAGLGIFVWPTVLHHTTDLAAANGVRCALLAGLGLTAVLGFRYPVQMIPLLLFELIWKSTYLLFFALPLYLKGQVPAGVADDTMQIVLVVIFLPLIPWGYVVKRYILAPGDSWR